MLTSRPFVERPRTKSTGPSRRTARRLRLVTPPASILKISLVIAALSMAAGLPSSAALATASPARSAIRAAQEIRETQAPLATFGPARVPVTRLAFGAGQARVSALVGLEGPSVFELFSAISGAGRPPRTTARIAAGHADLLRSMKAEVLARQAPSVAAIEQLGADVVSRYSVAANGLLVHSSPREIASITDLPGIRFVEPAPLVSPDLAFSVPHIGAKALSGELGYDGDGTTVAVIDTGVDYTHAHLGGPGTAEAFAAANAPGATERIDDTWDGAPLFPNGKVVGGWDFVGPRYNPPHICTAADEAAGECTSTPEPDPDPLDGGSHGTHVAGIVAGEAIPGVADGVAPGARIVALKLYGSGGADEAADVLVDAIEWCAGVNLGLEDRGIGPQLQAIDAINISLGEVQAQGSRLFDAAVEAAVGSGIVVVASAGNSGDRPFVLGAPSASPRILSVASSVPPSTALAVTAHRESGTETYSALEGAVSRPLREVGLLEAELAWFGRGCDIDEPIQDVDERIALVERGECVFAEKILNAQAAGAIAVLVFSDTRAKTAMGGDGTGVGIPAAMIDRAPGLELVEDLTTSRPVRVVLDPDSETLDTAGIDAVSGFSSRGPSRNGALKPDITGPGQNIVSARRGGGNTGVSFSGTSMSGPHLAGAAAVMQQRNAAESLNLGADRVAALLMNYAKPVVHSGGRPVPVVRQGAGLVDMVGSGHADIVVRTGDIASINAGHVAAVDTVVQTHTLTLANLGAEAVRLRLEPTFAFDDDAPAGVEIGTPEGAVTVPAGGEAEVDLSVLVDPSSLREWTLLGPAGAAVGPVEQLEIDGYVRAVPVDASDEPIGDALVASVPFNVLPRRASDIVSAIAESDGSADPVGRDAPALQLTNDSRWAGAIELFAVPALGDKPAPEDPPEEDVLYELDIRRVGVRLEPGRDGEGEDAVPARLSFLLTSWSPAAIPQVTRAEFHIDTDRDGQADWRVYDASAGDAMTTRFAAWDAELGGWGAEASEGTAHVADLHAHGRMLSVPLEALGLTGSSAFDFHVVHRGLNEDWLFTPSNDVAPDGALESAAPEGAPPRYSFEPALLGPLPERWSLVLDGGASERVPFLEPDATDPAAVSRPRHAEAWDARSYAIPSTAWAWLAWLPSDAPSVEAGQIAVFDLRSELRGRRALLPIGLYLERFVP